MKKYFFIKQKDLKDCGCCCLLMITRYFGGSVSLEYLREITNTTRDGVTAFDLIEGSKKIGFSAYGVNGDITNLQSNNTPCIAHVVLKKSYEHFIVIYEINHKKKTLTIADPSNKGISKMSFNEFKKISSNNFIILRPNKKIKYIEKNKHFDNFFIRLLHINKNILISIFLLSILISCSQILLSFEFKIMMEYVIDFSTKYNILLLSSIFLALILLKEISNFERNTLTNKLNHALDKSLLSEVYYHILSLPYLYYKNRTTGEVVSRINDVGNIREVISKFFISILFDLMLLVAAFFILFSISIKLTFIVLIAMILFVVLILVFNKLIEDSIINVKKSASDLNSFLVESISGIETVRNQNILEYIKKKFLLKNSLFNKDSYQSNKLFISESLIKNLIISLSNLGIIVVGSMLCVSNEMTLASLITYVTLTSYVFSPILGITELIISIKNAKISYERIRELYEVEEEKKNTRFKFNSELTGKIRINNLSYSYNNHDDVVKNINMDIKPGSKLLIHGDSGSGKSTIAKILGGMLDVSSKKIYLDDIDLNKLPISYLREHVCYVSSNDTLFTNSVYENIVLGRHNTSDLNEILDICQVDEFISNNPLEYDMLIEENGFNLSGGQKQRILLARSLLKNADIYILDESLNQVDIGKEREILKKIFNKYKNKTFIYISHRFHNEDLFDKKYHIKNGVCIDESS